ncbi:antibiotic biosynthesis monooxygenase [Richelia sinica FACHB-800]|uniref:Antibiotic biosynthesis monooxygenase n=1 Tax=Richelia sinica FACHB-800 TaxID=1357546 RepID=A0A975T8S7_9NOST|nr:hypothetical protein [Richelia sinica]QXE24199.1 antibiotic biosynthesis monooxygenase [Richelia sinica FACHB-800]
MEEWSSNEDLDVHLSSPHLQAAAAQLEGLVALPPDIRRYQILA